MLTLIVREEPVVVFSWSLRKKEFVEEEEEEEFPKNTDTVFVHTEMMGTAAAVFKAPHTNTEPKKKKKKSGDKGDALLFSRHECTRALRALLGCPRTKVAKVKRIAARQTGKLRRAFRLGVGVARWPLQTRMAEDDGALSKSARKIDFFLLLLCLKLRNSTFWFA